MLWRISNRGNMLRRGYILTKSRAEDGRRGKLRGGEHDVDYSIEREGRWSAPCFSHAPSLIDSFSSVKSITPSVHFSGLESVNFPGLIILLWPEVKSHRGWQGSWTCRYCPVDLPGELKTPLDSSRYTEREVDEKSTVTSTSPSYITRRWSTGKVV